MLVRPRMVLGSAFLGLVMTLSCGPQKRQPPPARVWVLSVRSVYNSYVDNSNRWTGETVDVVLRAKSYSIENGRIVWKAEREEDGPSVIFSSSHSLPDNTSAIEIRAVCVGRVFDNYERDSGRNWHVGLTTQRVRAVKVVGP